MLEFPHRDCVAKLSLSIFKRKYQRWCEKSSYHYCINKAKEIHCFARETVAGVPLNESVSSMVKQAATFLNSSLENSNALITEMNRISALLPEYETVMNMFAVGETVGPQLMAEIGDPRRFHSGKAITAYFGYDTEPDDSGQHTSTSRPMTKKGTSALRRALFTIMLVMLQRCPTNDPVYQFLDKKRSEGKHYYCYMNAAANKFLRIYRAKICEALNNADNAAVSNAVYS